MPTPLSYQEVSHRDDDRDDHGDDHDDDDDDVHAGVSVGGLSQRQSRGDLND